MLLASTPSWVIEGKDWLALVASFVGAVGLVWRYAVKPFFEHLEVERKREIDIAVKPLQDAIDRVSAKTVHLGDALSGVNLQIRELQVEQKSLHADVREHMQVEDASKDGH